jgi:SpoVK/Ycf46/Vps4 family AAA+-type ATPase
VDKATGYSGRDIASVCQHAVSAMVKEKNPDLEKLDAKQLESYALVTRELLPEDFVGAFEKIKPSASADMMDRYDEWNKEFG